MRVDRLLASVSQKQLFFWEDRSQVLEHGPGAGLDLVGVEPIDFFDADQPEITLAFLGRPHLPGYGVPSAQAEPADLGLGDVHVPGTGVGINLPQEAVAVVHGLQHPRGHQVLLGRCDLEHPAEQFLPPQAGQVAVVG